MAILLGGIQPIYLPWLGYFDQMRRVDVFVISDELPFSSSSYFHRNRIKGPRGPHWLTLPARPRRGESILDVRLDRSVPWKRKHIGAIRHFYARGTGTAATVRDLDTLLPADTERLVEVTIPTIRYLADRLGVQTRIVTSSELGLEARYRERFPDQPGPTYRIIAYMEALGATQLLEGESGQSYFDTKLFEAHGKQVHFHRYAHPTYPQLHGPFVSHMSALDLLLSVGAEQAAAVLAAGKLRDAS